MPLPLSARARLRLRPVRRRRRRRRWRRRRRGCGRGHTQERFGRRFGRLLRGVGGLHLLPLFLRTPPVGVAVVGGFARPPHPTCSRQALMRVKTGPARKLHLLGNREIFPVNEEGKPKCAQLEGEATPQTQRRRPHRSTLELTSGPQDGRMRARGPAEIGVSRAKRVFALSNGMAFTACVSRCRGALAGVIPTRDKGCPRHLARVAPAWRPWFAHPIVLPPLDIVYKHHPTAPSPPMVDLSGSARAAWMWVPAHERPAPLAMR